MANNPPIILSKLFTRSIRSVIIALSAVLLISCQNTQPVIEESATTRVIEKENIVPVTREMRGAWIATVSNMDWPSEPGLPVEVQKEELIRMLDRAAAMNLNAIIFQVRPAADALYDSPYEPWSVFLTGEMGKAPEPYYDPLEFAVKEAHKRGLELHAWLNPYRATHPSFNSEPSADYISNTNPEYLVDYGRYAWMDPGLPEVQDLSHKVILDVVNRYNVDGIHLDDYYYPYPSGANFADFPDSLSWKRAVEEGTTLSRNDWRRQNVNRFIERLYTDIKKMKPHVKFGISPIGYWHPGHPKGTFGFDAYEQIYADSRLWLREGWLDNFIPQLYTKTAMIARSFPEMLQWWEEQNWKDRHVWAGVIPSSVKRDWEAEEILTQVYIARGQTGVSGSVHFRMQDFLINPKELSKQLAAGPYAEPALIPSAPWLNNIPPDVPDADIEITPGEMIINITPSDEDDVRWWVIRSRTGENFTDNIYTEENYWEIDIVPGSEHGIVYSGTESTVWPDTIVITAVDRLGNESPGIELLLPRENRERAGESITHPEIIDRSAWGKEPVGHFANATRRNIGKGDTLRFRELSLIVHDLQPDELLKDSNDIGSYKGVSITLSRYNVKEELKMPLGSAINWYGYHIGILAANCDNKVTDDAFTEIEVATIASLAIPRMLSLPRASVLTTGEAERRLRVPHSVKNITLFQSGRGEFLSADEDINKQLMELYNWSIEERNYWDVPYHYIIGPDGSIYEGRDSRFAGESMSSDDPQGHLIIKVLGSNRRESSQEQRDAIADLVAWSAEKYDVPLERINSHGNWVDNNRKVNQTEIFLEQATLNRMVETRLKE